jgi:SAM-dependent methyltransferase
MTDRFAGDPPSAFVVEWAARAAARLPAPRRALDVAMGRGRHACALARLGLRTFGVDRNLEAVRAARDVALVAGVTIDVWCADLTVSSLPRAAFAMVVVTRYLQRDLFPAIRDATVPGGVVIYETFTSHQRALGWGPRSAAHLLEPGELARAFEGWETLFYEEVSAPEAVARLVARRT